MSCITTFSKRQFDPCEPDIDAIAIEDIAHALSLMCRGGGHIAHFYSVCQHSLACEAEAHARGYSAFVRLACLLHDASEAYLADITRPVKQRLGDYAEYEKQLQGMIYVKFLGRLPNGNECEQIAACDDGLLYHEFLSLNGKKLFEKPISLCSAPDFSLVDFSQAEQQFLRVFAHLTAEVE